MVEFYGLLKHSQPVWVELWAEVWTKSKQQLYETIIIYSLYPSSPFHQGGDFYLFEIISVLFRGVP